MNQVVAIKPNSGDIMESVIAAGDLSKLPAGERVRYYNEVCRSIGLNPLVQPFSYIVLNGKLTLYATRTCADQLRKINGVSLEIVSRQLADGILTVHVRAKMPDGRCDEDFGSVSFPDTLKGEARANAELKAVTKAKRRATLSICGLGWLDETEVADIPAAAKMAPPKQIATETHDVETGEIYSDQESSVTTNGLTQEQIERLQSLIAEVGADIGRFCKYLRVDRIENIPPVRFAFAVDALEAKRKGSA